MKPHMFSTVFCEFVLILPHHLSALAALAKPSQFVSILPTILLNSSQTFLSLPNSVQLFSPLPTSSQFFSTRLNSSHPSPPLFNPSHLFSPPLSSSHLFLNFFHPMSTLLISCQLFSALLTSSHLFLFTGVFYTETFTQSTFLHRYFFNTEKPLRRAKPLRRDVFTQSTLLDRKK